MKNNWYSFELLRLATQVWQIQMFFVQKTLGNSKELIKKGIFWNKLKKCLNSALTLLSSLTPKEKRISRSAVNMQLWAFRGKTCIQSHQKPENPNTGQNISKLVLSLQNWLLLALIANNLGIRNLFPCLTWKNSISIKNRPNLQFGTNIFPLPESHEKWRNKEERKNWPFYFDGQKSPKSVHGLNYDWNLTKTWI